MPNPFSFAFSKVTPTQLNGGTVKIVDSRTFNVATTISAAEVTVEPGAMRSVPSRLREEIILTFNSINRELHVGFLPAV